MKIENPAEVAALVAKNDELVAQFADFEATKEKLITAEATIGELKQAGSDAQTEMEALKQENDTLKEAARVAEEIGEQIKAETAKVVELTDTVARKDNEISSLQAEVSSMKEKSEAFESLAAEYAEESEAVAEQFELVKSHLMPKGATPDIETAIAPKQDSEVYTSWKTKALSRRPEDRRAARKMLKASKEISESIAKNTQVEESTNGGIKLSADQMAVFAEWQGMLNSAKENEKKNSKLHAEDTVRARMFYKKNKEAIDVCIAAQASA